MKTLIVAEHDNQTLKAATLNAVAAAQQLGGDIDVLVVGSGCQAAADAAAAVPDVASVLLADNAAYENQLAENVSLAVADVADVDEKERAQLAALPVKVLLSSSPQHLSSQQAEAQLSEMVAASVSLGGAADAIWRHWRAADV